MLQTGRVQQGPSFCVRSPRGSGARVSAVYTVHSIQHPIQHPLGDGRPAGRSESVPNNGARGRPSPRLKREPHSTVCCLSTGDHRINHHDRPYGWVGQTSSPHRRRSLRQHLGRDEQRTRLSSAGFAWFARLAAWSRSWRRGPGHTRWRRSSICDACRAC